jgi:L-fuconolactonase
MIVDSHHHLWEIGRFEYPWMPAAGHVLHRDYLPEDLRPWLDRNGVDRTVIVQANQSVEESRWLLGHAEKNAFVGGVVGWVDLKDPHVGTILDDLAQTPRFKGVRHVWHDEPNDDWILQPKVIRGLREVAARGLTYDFLTFPRHLRFIPMVLAQVPGLKAVVDHISKPPIAKGGLEPWRSELRKVAEIPGVYCKLSGMVTEADLDKWTIEDLRPYVEAVVEMFGCRRLMYGSDWPVCTMAASYDRVFETAQALLSHLSEDDRRAVFGENAIRFYCL